MNALAWMQSTGVAVGLTSGGGLELDGLERLDDALYARVLDVARTHKAELLAELREGASAPPVPPTDPAMAALVRFESNPHGTVAWLADPVNHASRDPEHSARWRACIQHEAQLRVEEANQ